MAAKMVPKWIQSRSKKRWKRKKEKMPKLHWRLSGSTILRVQPARKDDDLAAEVDKKTYSNRSQNQDQFSSRCGSENGAKMVATGSQDAGQIGIKAIKNRSQN